MIFIRQVKGTFMWNGFVYKVVKDHRPIFDKIFIKRSIKSFAYTLNQFWGLLAKMYKIIVIHVESQYIFGVHLVELLQYESKQEMRPLKSLIKIYLLSQALFKLLSTTTSRSVLFNLNEETSSLVFPFKLQTVALCFRTMANHGP